MPDLDVVATVSRSLLGLGDLDINDHSSYVVAGPQPISGQVTWERRQVSAPWVDGDITYQRRRTNVVEPITIYVRGTTMSELDSRFSALKDAFMQDRYTVQMEIGGVNHAWDCEAADITSATLDTAHLHALYVAVTFAVPRKPVPLAGGF